VSRWLLGGIAATSGATLLYVVKTIRQSRRSGSLETVPSLIGELGTVASDLAPRGLVRLSTGTWTAVSEDGNLIPQGESVRVTQVDGLILTVSRQEDTNT